MFFGRLLAPLLLVVAAGSLTACGGGGDDGTQPPPTASLTVSGAAGGLAVNNGGQNVGAPTVTVTVVGNTELTSVVSPLSPLNPLLPTVGSISVTFDADTGNVTAVRLTLGTSGQPTFLSASCAPCSGATVDPLGRSILLVDTPIFDSLSFLIRLATLDGLLLF